MYRDVSKKPREDYEDVATFREMMLTLKNERILEKIPRSAGQIVSAQKSAKTRRDMDTRLEAT